MKAKEILRWTTVLLFGGSSVYLLGGGGWHLLHNPNRDWVFTAFNLVFLLLFSALPLAVAWLAYFRQYRRLAQMGLVLGTFVLLGQLSQLVLGLTGGTLHGNSGHEPIWQDLLSLPVFLLPWGGTALFYKYAKRMIDRYLPAPYPTEAQRARTRRWEERVQPVRRGWLRVTMAGAELLAWATVLVFIGTLVWLWQASGGLDGTDEAGRNSFGLGLVMMVGCLLLFLVSLMVRSDCRTQLQEISAAQD